MQFSNRYWWNAAAEQVKLLVCWHLRDHGSTLTVHGQPIHTTRLMLWQMTVEFLDASLDGTCATANLQFVVHSEWLAQSSFIELRRGQYRREPGYEAWGVWAIVQRDTGRMVGHIGFHTVPNAEYLQPYVNNAVEFGYVIYPSFRSLGFATEASRALIDWAFREKLQRRFIVSISPSNSHSQAIARKLGFVKIAEWQDEVDGTEEVFLLELATGQTP